jgi:hypothetical protein
VAAVAAGGQEFLVSFLSNLGEVRIGALQVAFLRFPRRLGRADTAALTTTLAALATVSITIPLAVVKKIAVRSRTEKP